MMLKIEMIIEIIQILENNIDDGNVNNDYEDKEKKQDILLTNSIPMSKG